MNDRLDLMTSISGVPITTKEEWEQFRRPELMMLLEDFVYGARPYEKPDNLSFTLKRQEQNRFGTNAVFKEVEVHVNNHSFPFYLFVPGNANEHAKKPVPTFIWVENEFFMEKTDFEKSIDYDFLPIPEILERGFAIAVMPVYFVSPDWIHHAEFKKGVFSAMEDPTHRTDRSWATISGWAFGMSRILDYLETDIDTDALKAIAIGHSRGGKTALWAGATDPRFSLVISNSSGCTGAAYTRGKKGEHIKDINVSDWFCANYRRYNNREDMLPVDQHMLLAAIAPRPLYVKSDVEDEWSDPEAELKSARLASAAYEIYGLPGLLMEDETPVLGKQYHEGTIGYHLAPGDHNLTRFDWRCYMDFADKKIR